MTARLPLQRFTVIDLTLHRAGPTAARQLADWGARVIKVESYESAKGDAIGSNRNSPDFQNLHRNKQAMTLNLKTKEGKDILYRLVEKADVVIENFRSDVKFRLGVDYETLCKINPRLVYGSISGFGQDGPYATRPGVDQIAQGMGGLMSITGLPGQGPVRVGIPITDLCAGQFLAQGILIALLDREVTGKGQWVQTSLLEAQVFMLDFQAARWLIANEVARQAGNDHPVGIPTGVFPTADGYMNIAASSEMLWRRLCAALGAPELAERPDFATGAQRSQNRIAVNETISAITRTKPTAEWDRILLGAGIPAGPIYSIDQVFADPQVQHLEIARPVAHAAIGTLSVVSQPIHLSEAPQPEQLRPAPQLSEHTDAIMTELGYDHETIARLRDTGVI
jgi:formyl-CoA transferase